MKRGWRKHRLRVYGLGVLLVAAGTARAGDCVRLAGERISARAISLPTRGAIVDSAQLDTAQPQSPVCVVLGRVQAHHIGSPDIRFEVNLPEHWNGKAVHQGGGGWNGVLVDGRHFLFLPPPGPGVVTSGETDAPATVDITAQGYATFGSDSGHQQTPSQDDVAFALDEEALRNYGGDQLKKVHDVALELLRRHYGRNPRRLYFYGGSKGGQEALAVAQRWPEAYDGVVALFPAYDFTALIMDYFLTRRIAASAAIDKAGSERIAAAVMQTCDGLDGLQDGIISNLPGCRAAFDPKSLECSKGASEDCVTGPQVGSALTLSKPVQFGFSVAGRSDYPGWPLFEGMPSQAITALYQQNAAWYHRVLDQVIRYMICRDPAARSEAFEPRSHATRLQYLSGILDARSANLDGFRRRGGKLLLLHGSIDSVVLPGNSVAYYERLQGRYGASLREFMRFYMVPGFGHGDGSFYPLWDSLKTLDRWADGQEMPEPQFVTDALPGHHSRSRPLCEYRDWPRYQAGNPDDAGNFICSRPMS